MALSRDDSRAIRREWRQPPHGDQGEDLGAQSFRPMSRRGAERDNGVLEGTQAQRILQDEVSDHITSLAGDKARTPQGRLRELQEIWTRHNSKCSAELGVALLNALQELGPEPDIRVGRDELARRIFKQINEWITDARPDQFVLITESLASLGCLDSDGMIRLTDLLVPKLIEFEPDHLANLARALPRHESTTSHLVVEIHSLLSAQLESLSPEDLGYLCSLSYQRGAPLEGLRGFLSRQSVEQLERYSPAALSAILTQFSGEDAKESLEFDALVRVFSTKRVEAEHADLAKVLKACEVSTYHDRAQILLLAEEFETRLEETTFVHLVYVCSCLSRYEMDATGPLYRLGVLAGARDTARSPALVAQAADLLAKAEIRHTDVYQGLAEGLLKGNGANEVQIMGWFGRSLMRANVYLPGFMEALHGLILSSAGRDLTGSLPDLAHVIAYFNHATADVCDKLLEAFAQGHPELDDPDLAFTLWSFGTMREHGRIGEVWAVLEQRAPNLALTDKAVIALYHVAVAYDLNFPECLQEQLELALEAFEGQEFESNVFEAQVESHLQAHGVDFQGQVPVAGYRVDFVVSIGDRKIALECDGARFHYVGGQRELGFLGGENLREKILKKLGYEIIRIDYDEWKAPRNPQAILKAALKVA